jgi:hypothetical protein
MRGAKHNRVLGEFADVERGVRPIDLDHAVVLRVAGRGNDTDALRDLDSPATCSTCLASANV